MRNMADPLKSADLPWMQSEPNNPHYADDHRTMMESTGFTKDNKFFHPFDPSQKGQYITHTGTFWSNGNIHKKV